jgi:hypothetical protein
MRNMPGFTKTKAPGDWSVFSKSGELLEFYGGIVDLTDVNPGVQNRYRGPHGSLISQAVWTAPGA